MENNKINDDEIYDVVICIPSHNRFKKVNRLLKQFKEQPSKYKYKIILLNDGSSDIRYELFPIKYNLHYIKNKKPNGKEFHWYCYNQMWEALRDIKCRTVLQMDDDFILCDNFLNRIVGLYDNETSKDKQIAAVSPHLWSFEIERNERWWNNKHLVDGIALLDINVIISMNYGMSPVDTDEVSKPGAPVRAWPQIGKAIKDMDKIIYRTENSLVYHDGNDDSKLHGDVRKNGITGIYTQKFIDDMKTFDGDFYKFINKIQSGEHFSLSRWGDGELMILEDKFIDLRKQKNGEFRYDPELDEYKGVRNKLQLSYTSTDDEYYIGVACPCCVGEEKYEYMKRKSHQDEEHLTWANIFVNSNYKLFLTEFVPAMNGRDVVIVANEKADTSKLPFNVEKTYKVGTDAWLNDYSVVDRIKYEYRNKKDRIFLFAAGPLANILTYELWFYMNKDNTYIDIGSTLDTQMGMRPTRGYHRGAKTLNKTCIW